MTPGVNNAQTRLRVAMIWNQTIHAEHLLIAPRAVVLGYGEEALFPLPEPEASRGNVTLLSQSEQGYTLHLQTGADGAVWLLGQRHEVRDLLAQRRPRIELARGDYGVVSLGATSYFFQHVKLPPPATRALHALDGERVLSFGLSLFVHACLLALMLLAQREQPTEQTLDVPPELVTRFAVTPPLEEVDESPDQPAPEKSQKKKKDDGGGKRSAREEGKLGKRDAQREDHQIEGDKREAIATKVRGMGLLGALSGGDGLKGALPSDNVGALLGGLGSSRTELGMGAGGRGLRGVGAGGGGDGPGALLGGGALGTGIGAGRGGKGAGGKGRGAGGGGGRAEAQVQVTPGSPQVVGYLSAEQINRVVRANQAALRYCYESEVQRQRGLRGKIVLQWRVDRAGAVPMARVASSTLNNAGVEGCIVRQVKKWRFPKPDGGEVSVMYPFIFGIGG
jgi:outer membrane biosynthesis protein TonB